MRISVTIYAWLIAVVSTLSTPAVAGVADTKHNLSVSGKGLLKATGEPEICVFCHAPHTANPAAPQWNRTVPTRNYRLYSSSTMAANSGQPTGSSKLCLSCHDGTIALGELLTTTRPIELQHHVSGRSNLRTDLSDDHPISFRYDSTLAASSDELVDPIRLERTPVRLDANNQMQCTTCHTPHSSTFEKFLVMDNRFSALCITCHDKIGWSMSAHAQSAAGQTSVGEDPWPHTPWSTTAENGCLSCHTSHGAGSRERLMRQQAGERNCLSCHDGSVARTNIQRDLHKRSGHRVERYRLEHDPTEEASSMPPHVECEDCHNPHAVTSAKTPAPFTSGRLAQTQGVTQRGTPTKVARYQYEICFRCHGDVAPPVLQRQHDQADIRLKFEPANPSYHPVVAPSRSRGSSPSLLPEWAETPYIYCTDCHASDQGPSAGGRGPAGPHGSIWRFLLERRYTVTDGATESYQRYALCYKCHDRAAILGDRSGMPHRIHVIDARTSCATCHDPHGISVEQGDGKHNTHLINFNTAEVVPNSRQQLRFEDRGRFRGACSLRCHGRDHVISGGSAHNRGEY